MNLFLIGYRCSGKTTVGKSIAMTIDWSFVDSDLLVIKKNGNSIKDIIDTAGWDAFRRMERSTLRQICTKDRQVVATGGGVVLDADNIKAMKASGTVVWLEASAATIQERMRQDKNTENFRPALTDKGRMEEIEDMLLKRNPYYESASDFSIHTDDVPFDEITQNIIQKIRNKIGA
ncbi:MAG: shikimate kinase [Deltaproteobacteria bacterium]|jgi:shikimate kinase|nr:shikimate kinase [Deltaproteobacteria bacterium]